jgi:hypothetical protein
MSSRSTQRSKALYNLNGGLFYSFHHWPRGILKILTNPRVPSDRSRFSLIVFLLVNGFDPALCEEYMNDLWSFDRHQMNHIIKTIQKYPFSNWTAWNIHEERSTGPVGGRRTRDHANPMPARMRLTPKVKIVEANLYSDDEDDEEDMMDRIVRNLLLPTIHNKEYLDAMEQDPFMMAMKDQARKENAAREAKRAFYKAL